MVLVVVNLFPLPLFGITGISLQNRAINLSTHRYFLLNVVLEKKTTILVVSCHANEHVILIEQLCFGFRKGCFVKWPSGSEGQVKKL